MSKSILVIDTPETCVDCPCCFTDNAMIWCGKQHEVLCEPMTIPEGIERFKPDWCPLQELPRKMSMDNQPFFDSSYVAGRNACIDEILEDCNNFAQFEN